MGNAASQPANANAGQQPAHTDVRLFKACIRSDKSFEWELLGENVQPHFYDINADTSSNSPTEWHLEFEGSVDYPDVVVSDGMQFQAAELKCVFSAAEGTEWWALSFPDERQFAAFHQSYNGHLFENRYQTDLSEENVQRELGVYAGGLGGGLGGGETDAQQQQWVEDMDIDEPVRAGDAHAGVRSEGRLVDRKATSELTSLVLGENDRSFVVGREGISVMKNTLHGLEDLDLEVSFDSLRLGSDRGHTPRSTRRSTGKSSPLTSCSKGILMDSEEKMNLLSSTGRSIFNIDPEKEGVVRELGFGDMSGILDIVNETKGTAEATDTFLSLAPQSVDKWDLRVAERGGLVQTMASPTVDSLSHGGGRTYKSKTKFSCIATTADGYRAVGSQDGTIRLYNDQMTQVRNSIPRAPIPLARSPARPLARSLPSPPPRQISKTNIPSLGAPIDHIDVTFDGRWVLATTKTFIIVLKTMYKEGSKELCGFTSRLGSRAPKPRLLMLRPEDRVYTNNAPFEKARFSWVDSRNRSEKERYIVATCGRYTVQWNFRAVKIAKPDVVTNGLTTVQKYALIPKSEDILDTNFMHAKAREGGGVRSPGSLVVLTKQRVWNVEEEDEEEDSLDR